MSYVVTVKKESIQGHCLGNTVHDLNRHFGLAFFNLPEGVTTDVTDLYFIADVCPAECSWVVSKVKSPMLQIRLRN
jgi:hypothetical protein